MGTKVVDREGELQGKLLKTYPVAVFGVVAGNINFPGLLSAVAVRYSSCC
jgi:hypothetical protein